MEDPRVQAFRKELNKWKKDHFFVKLVNEVNSDSEDRRISEARDMYDKLMKKLHEMEQTLRAKQVGGDQESEKLLQTLGPEGGWSEALLDQVRSILITDLLEYPLTFNASLIDQFKQVPDFPTYK
jgi:16S rRNA U1498 N3-methylase RsmE